MLKNRVLRTVLLVFVLIIFAGSFSYPQYINEGIGFINGLKISFLGLKLQFPYFPDIPFRLGLDLQGGTHLVYEADLSSIEKEDHSLSMQGLRDVIERRIDIFGVQEPVVQVQESAGHYRLIVELAGILDPAEAIKMIGETPYLEFKEQRSEQETEEILKKQEQIMEQEVDPEGFFEIADWQLILEDPYFKPTPLTGKYLKKAELGFDQTSYMPLVALEFDEEGARLFEELTEKNIGRLLAIYIDNVPISMPSVQEKISGGRAQISGNFSIEEARALARNLNAGALPVPITLVSQQTVGPTLGRISLENSLKAGLFGLLAIIIFMIVVYRLPGFLSFIELIVYLSLVLTIFKLIPVTLTLAGIGGLILSIGMAVDANVLIFSRMREELKEGKKLKFALEDGFKRAWPSIRDANATTLIVATILFSFGTSFIKGFALTLGIGILISVFSVLVITKNLLRCFPETRFEKIKWLW